MNPAPTFERVYAAIKQRAMFRAWLPGQHIDLASLADDLQASVTPVRDALYRLVGERILTTGLSEGFAMPALTEPELSDLYAWNQQLLSLALRTASSGPTSIDEMPGSVDLIGGTRTLFRSIADRARNSELSTAVEAISDRLHGVRITETRLQIATEDEYENLRNAAVAGDIDHLRSRMTAYHRRRIRLAGRIVYAHWRSEPTG